MENLTLSNIEHFLSKITFGEGCWEWNRGLFSTGYGQFHIKTIPIGAHRVSYWLFKGGVSSSQLHLDHLCRNKKCVNPSHLELVTNRENLMRSELTLARQNADKTHCKHGHEFNADNTYIRNDRNGGRECKMCRKLSVLKHINKRG